ncbi:MAG: hypothetical protein KDK27_18725, partial [Leptospiraceae bacterium]|nr:hypothetical protein [Leptospiraceae bacterium]
VLDLGAAMVNQYNPVIFSANAYRNVENATRFSTGKSHSYMWEAQALAAVRQPIVATGSALMISGAAAASTGVGAAAGGPMFVLGMALSALGNSIQVNPTTGERSTKMTDAAAINTAISVVTSAIGGASLGATQGLESTKAMADAGQATQQAVSAAQASANTLNYATHVASIGSAAFASGATYDAKGNYQGWHSSGKQGSAIAVDTTIAAATAWAGANTQLNTNGMGPIQAAIAQGLKSDAISTPLSVLGEYYKHTQLGAGYSNFTAMQNPGFERLGALGAIGWQGAFQTKVNAQIQSQAYIDFQQQKEAANRYNLMQIIMGAADVVRKNQDGSQSIRVGRAANIIFNALKEQGVKVSFEQAMAMAHAFSENPDGAYSHNTMVNANNLMNAYVQLGGSFYFDFNAQHQANINARVGAIAQQSLDNLHRAQMPAISLADPARQEQVFRIISQNPVDDDGNAIDAETAAYQRRWSLQDKRDALQEINQALRHTGWSEEQKQALQQMRTELFLSLGEQ